MRSLTVRVQLSLDLAFRWMSDCAWQTIMEFSGKYSRDALMATTRQRVQERGEQDASAIVLLGHVGQSSSLGYQTAQTVYTDILKAQAYWLCQEARLAKLLCIYIYTSNPHLVRANE